jgi:hypothetical protein
MARIEARLAALGLILPPPTKPPPGVVLPFQFVLVRGRRAFISGHGPQHPDGSFAPPLGKLGRDLDLFGPDVGAHSRSAVGMAELPFDIPVEIEGEVELVAQRAPS